MYPTSTLPRLGLPPPRPLTDPSTPLAGPPPDDLDALARAVQELRAPLAQMVLARNEAGGAGVGSGASLSAPQHLTLAALAAGPLAMSELARATGVAVSTATRMVQGLSRAGLVEPAAVGGGDARRRYVAVTPAGRAAAEREGAAQLARVRELLGRLDPARRAAVVEGLRAITDALETMEREAGAGDAPGLRGGG